MFVALVILFIVGYLFVAGISYAKYQAVKSEQCGKGNHFGPYSWCGHTCAAIWFVGTFWPLALPVVAGVGLVNRKKDKS